MEYKSLVVGYILGCSSMLLAHRINKKEWRLFGKNKIKSPSNNELNNNQTTNSTQTSEFKWKVYGYLYKYPDNVHVVERGIANNDTTQYRAISMENEYVDLTNITVNEIENDTIVAFDNGDEYIFTKSIPHIETMHGC